MKGKLWINPFLDTFYEWGLGKYWKDKLSFLKFLDLTENIPVEMEEYIKEKVPEWYWKGGFSMHIGQSYYDGVLKAWESGEPFKINIANVRGEVEDEWNFGYSEKNVLDISNAQDYIGYPEYLKSGGDILNLYPHGGSYVKMVFLMAGRTKYLFNSLLFTTEKGKSWCDMSSISKFLNWRINPLEGKQ